MKLVKQYALFATLSLCGATASATPILYAGDLSDGVTQAGMVQNDSISSRSNYQYWQFSANPGDQIEVTALRSEYYHDVVMSIWAGLFGDTNALGSALYYADDTINSPGPYGDPRVRFSATGGSYTVGIYDHSAGGYHCSGLCDYTISVLGSTASVPEPAAMSLLGLGLLSLGLVRRRRAALMQR